MAAHRNIALVHDWLASMRGGERVLEVLCELFPDAPLYTLIHRTGALSPAIERMDIRTSFIQRMPLGTSHYQHYLPLFPAAARSFDLRSFDVVLSSSSAWAKAVRVRSDALHVCYCHTPMRYIWDQYDQYFGKGRGSPLNRMAMRALRPYLQRWDREASAHVNYFIANSRTVQERIKRIYGKDALVICPPADTDRFSLSEVNEGHYVIVSALVPYKRIDIAIEAFNRLGNRLIVIGVGNEEARLRAKANENIQFLGYCTDEQIALAYAKCRAIIFPGEEDFGIVPVEAMACGKPVIAFGRGGVTETVVDGKTGLLFSEQTAESLLEAVRRFEHQFFDPVVIRSHALQFGKNRFRNQILQFFSGLKD